MYEEFYGLTEKPFSIQPDPSFLYWGRGHRLAYAMLEYGVVNQAGISVITGEVGCGKTTLIHRLLDQLSDTHTVALLSNIQSGRGELLSWVLMGYGEPYAGKSHVEMFAQLQQFFIREYAKGKRVVLIIDEAQNLSVDMLEELRMLSNINAGKDQLLQLILVGQPQLKDLLSRPDMLQLAQRIGSDFHLTPLSREEVHAYIDTRLTIAGARRRIFSDKSMDVIAEQSRGVPRVINIIADTALVYAFSAQSDIVTEDLVRSVIRDKMDYGVFGLASSPDVKLTEWREPRAAGFLREAPRNGEAAPASAVASDAQPRLVRTMGVKLVASSDPAEMVDELAAPPIGGKSLYAEHSQHAPAFPKPAPYANGSAARSTPETITPPPSAVVAPAPAPVSTPRLAPEPSASKAGAGEVGLVIIGGGVAAAQAMGANAGAVVVVTGSGETEQTLADAGLEIVELSEVLSNGGRARNAGYRRLKKVAPDIKYVQFVEAGARLEPSWLDFAARFLARRPEVAALEGKTIDVSTSTSVFQKVLTASAHGPDGEAQATGPSAIFRADAFEAAGGFRGDIVADETADLCIRLRRRGAHVWRSEATMATFSQPRVTFKDWRRQCAARGYGFAADAALHGAPPERFRATEQARAVMWGAVIPLLALVVILIVGVAAQAIPLGVGAFGAITAALFVALVAYALKIALTAVGKGPLSGFSWLYGFISSFGHFFEASGVAKYWFSARDRGPVAH